METLICPAVGLIERVVITRKKLACVWNLPFLEEYINDLRKNESVIPFFQYKFLNCNNKIFLRKIQVKLLSSNFFERTIYLKLSQT